MAKVGMVMGSDSDMPVMAKAAEVLEQLGIEYEMRIISAHREPAVFFEYANTAEEKGFKVIIAAAGMAAHLPGMCAAIFPMPVIGIPMHTTSLGGFAVFHCADAKRDSRGFGCHQRRRKCGSFGGENFSGKRCAVITAAERICQRLKRAGSGKR